MSQTIASRYNFGLGIPILLIEAFKPELAKALNIDNAKVCRLIYSFTN
jgi:hypothetical protein